MDGASMSPLARLISVNVARPREVEYRGRVVRTGIFKQPVPGRVRLRRLNLEGDEQADLRVHGGFDKAVYAYPFEHYSHWAQFLGRDGFGFGQFGENLTVEGLLEEDVNVGDVFLVGSARLQVSQPRAPCFKLGIKMGSQRFVKPFLASGRVGFYLRVLEVGEVGAGDAIRRIDVDPARLSVRDVSRLMYLDAADLAGARRAASVEALAAGWRREFEERLARAEGGDRRKA